MSKSKYYTLKNILSKNAHYNVIFGERSNGKTYSVLEYALKRYFETGEQIGIIRRWEEDFVGDTSMRVCYDSLSRNDNDENIIFTLSKGKYNGVMYYSGRYYLTEIINDKTERTTECIGVGFAVSAWEHYKSSAFPNIKTILFDEFMTRGRYLTNEFILFQNLLSTIIRRRNDVKIFMCANTVNKFGCPYFNEMGLHRIKEMKQGEIDIYNYGNSGLIVAVEFSDSPSKSKPSDVYFAFNNPRLQMITGNGCVWEMDIYPHCPVKYLPKHIKFTFFIIYDTEVLQCEVINADGNTFLFVHRKTTPLKNPDKDLIYKEDYDYRKNYRRNIYKPFSAREEKLLALIKREKVFYQDNETGEIFKNYINWCRKG